METLSFWKSNSVLKKVFLSRTVYQDVFSIAFIGTHPTEFIKQVKTPE